MIMIIHLLIISLLMSLPWYNKENEDIEGYLHFNDYKP